MGQNKREICERLDIKKSDKEQRLKDDMTVTFTDNRKLNIKYVLRRKQVVSLSRGA